MKLRSIMDRDFINLRAKVHTREEAIDLVLGQFLQDCKFKQSFEEIKKAVMDREELGGTLLENGMAVPHARLEGFDDLLVGIVIPEKPIEEPDGAVIKCLIVFLTTKSGSTRYLQSLASFARMARDPGQYHRFLTSRTEPELLQVLDDYVIEKHITVKDIMSSTIYSISQHSTLKDLVDCFYKNKTSYVPVISADDELLGEVDMNDLLKVGIPNYALMIGNLDFLSHFEPFEELLKNEDKIQVLNIMRKPKILLKPQTTLIEAALEMTKNNRRHLPVMDNGRIVGVVSFMDILSKVLRA